MATFNDLPASDKLQLLSGIYDTMKKHKRDYGYIGFDGKKMRFSDNKFEGCTIIHIKTLESTCRLLNTGADVIIGD